uniref:Uncharacterized protein n=1 Tax=Brassica oleracea TaxID=3712 RepID=A0A3P6F2V3_BRAOL|nr:unnamed protein product [Brassica oleracea]
MRLNADNNQGGLREKTKLPLQYVAALFKTTLRLLPTMMIL